jgi:uncharacterized Zn-binding protein involved in type VI secretion
MRGLARVGDRTFGTCFCHDTPISVGGTIIVGSPDTFTNNLPQARLGDTVLADCGHKGTIITASPTVLCNNKGVARLGDNTTGCYRAKIITASPDTLTP